MRTPTRPRCWCRRACSGVEPGLGHGIEGGVEGAPGGRGLLDFGNEPDAAQSLPDLENRAPSLVNWVGSHIDANLRSLLSRYSIADARVVGSWTRPVGSPSRRTWARHWKALSNAGIDLTISLEVSEAEDTIVSACVDEEKVITVEPPWITARQHGLELTKEQDATARSYFYTDLVEALEAKLKARASNTGLPIPA